MSLTPEQQLRAYVEYFRDLGVYELYRQASPEVARRLSDPNVDDAKYLLWFHHVPWTYRLPSGRTVWDELTFRYTRGVSTVATLGRSWSDLKPFIDPERFEKSVSLTMFERVTDTVASRIGRDFRT